MRLQEVFKALNDPTRRAIIALLRKDKMSAGSIVDHFHSSNATISHHLSILKQANLISDEKEGKYIYYELNTSVLEELIVWLSSMKEDRE